MEETQALLCAWSDERVQKSLSENLRNKHVFKHLSARMSSLGFSRSPHQCRLRVKTLKANYVRAKLLRSVDGGQPCTFRYYAEMDAVLGKARPADSGIQMICEVKSEDDREASTDEFEFSNAGFSQSLPVEGHPVFMEPHIASMATSKICLENIFHSKWQSSLLLSRGEVGQHNNLANLLPYFFIPNFLFCTFPL